MKSITFNHSNNMEKYFISIMNCMSDIMAPLWNGSSRYPYLARTASEINDAARTNDLDYFKKRLKAIYELSDSAERDKIKEHLSELLQ